MFRQIVVAPARATPRIAAFSEAFSGARAAATEKFTTADSRAVARIPEVDFLAPGSHCPWLLLAIPVRHNGTET